MENEKLDQTSSKLLVGAGETGVKMGLSSTKFVEVSPKQLKIKEKAVTVNQIVNKAIVKAQ